MTWHSLKEGFERKSLTPSHGNFLLLLWVGKFELRLLPTRVKTRLGETPALYLIRSVEELPSRKCSGENYTNRHDTRVYDLVRRLLFCWRVWDETVGLKFTKFHPPSEDPESELGESNKSRDRKTFLPRIKIDRFY